MIALIPARGGSKGVPRKNIKSLNGMPLISYSINSCKKVKSITDIIVSTDDLEISKVAEAFGSKILKRPSELAGDKTVDREVLKHFFSVYNCQDVVYIRPTTPIRCSKKIEEAITTYCENKNILTSLRSMHEFSESPYKMFKVNERGFCEGFFTDYNGTKDYTNLPRQSFPAAYQPNGYVDIIKKSTVDGGSSYGNKIFPYITDPVIEIDTQFEFDLLELQIKNHDKYKK